MMINCIFNRFENDIKKAYEDVYGNINDNNPEEISKASIICNSVLIDICQSFYFEKKYSTFRLMDIKDSNGHIYSYVSAPFKDDNTGIKNDPENKDLYYLRNGVFMSNISKSCNMLDCHFNKGIDEKSELMKKAIKENLMDNSFYANIFEENPIKKSLILKNKQDFTVSVFEKGMTVEDFGDIIKEQYITNEKDLDTYLNFSCGINFIKLERQSDYSFFIVHNNEDVVGVGALANNPFLKELPDSDKFKYLSFIAVNSAYRGHGVGLKISDEIMSHCVEKNYIYERSGASRDGSLYMEKKIDESSARYENKLPVIKEHYGETVRLYIKDKFKEGCNYEEERESLINKVIKLKAAEQEKGKLLKGDLKKIFGYSNINKIKY